MNHCLAALAFLFGFTSPAATSDKPNVVVILADDLGYECVAANGGQSYKTPNLDRLAKAGVRFEHSQVQPLCTPTRVQLMTGRYNIRNYINFGTLLRTETTFAQLPKKAGYATGICGKWQPDREKDSPRHFGFDESYPWQHTRRPRYANPGLEHNGEELNFTMSASPWPRIAICQTRTTARMSVELHQAVRRCPPRPGEADAATPARTSTSTEERTASGRAGHRETSSARSGSEGGFGAVGQPLANQANNSATSILFSWGF